MKPNFLFLIIPFFLLCSCDKQACEPNTISTTFSDNNVIHVSFEPNFQEVQYEIQEGDGIVFQHKYSKGHCEGNADDWYTLTLGFELPANSTDFALEDSALVNADCFVHHNSTWIFNDYPVTSGNIEGQKLNDDEWIVHGSITYTIPSISYQNDKTISFDEIFRK